MNIGFLVFADETSGFGHALRSLEIAKNIWHKESQGVTFLINQSMPDQLQKEIYKYHKIIKLPDITDKDYQSEVINTINKFKLLFTDLNPFNYQQHAFLSKSVAPRIVSLTMYDYQASRFEDISIFPTIEPKSILKSDRKPYFKFIGPEYYPIRKEVLEIAETYTKPKGQVKKIAISMGGTDPKELTIKTIESLKEMNLDIFFEVFITNETKNKSFIYKEAQSGKFIIHEDAKDFFQRLLDCDAAIINGGMTRFEVVRLGLPFISVSFDEKQSEISKNVINALGSGFDIFFEDQDFKPKLNHAIASFIDDKDHMLKAFLNRTKLIDGKGVRRISDIIESLIDEKISWI